MRKSVRNFKIQVVFSVLTAVVWPLAAAPARSGRYALILSDEPVANRVTSREQLQSVAAVGYRRQIQARQDSLRQELGARRITVTGSVQTLLNAVFVHAGPEHLAELQSLPGVVGVVALRRYNLNLNRAVQVVDAPAAWTTLGGVGSAGLGMKIGILDTGIDETHPAFQDPSLPMPSGYPICSGDDCKHVTNKVIVARSYVRMLAAGSDPANPAADSRPDDYSMRDRVGHGTATASIAAGFTNTGPAATITGVAPKAYLGIYKIFGSPGVNDSTTDDVIIQALEDAMNDGMDVASLSIGAAAVVSPLDTGAACGLTGNAPCDPSALAAENAVKLKMLVVAAAGNDGDSGFHIIPTLSTIETPGDAPSVLAVAAVTNSHTFRQMVGLTGADAPSGLQSVTAQFGDGPGLPAAGPMVDVTSISSDPTGCSALPAGSLTGAIVLVRRDPTACTFLVKVQNAESAGAIGVVIYMNTFGPLFTPGGLTGTTIPTAMISNSSGNALRTFLVSNPRHPGVMNPNTEVDVTGSLLVEFSSMGPSIQNLGLKPDVAAVGQDMYMATQNYDPDGVMYNLVRYISADGTSFSTPMVSGAAALVKQRHPNFQPLQIRSALINTASPNVLDTSGNSPGVLGVGGGKLDVNAAVMTPVTVNPATISFGALNSATLPLSQKLQVLNSGPGAVALNVAVNATSSSAQASLAVDKKTLSLAAGASDTVTVTLSGTTPTAGEYEGAISLQGSGVSLNVPYVFLMGNGNAANYTYLTAQSCDAISCFGFEGTVSEHIVDSCVTRPGCLSFRLFDDFGVPVVGAPVTWSVSAGGGTIEASDAKTDKNGVATAQVVLGPTPGSQVFLADVAGQTVEFDGMARAKPNITDIVDAGSFAEAKPVAPGSYIDIKGTGLSDMTDLFATPFLPLSLDGVIVSFDVPSSGISLPGRVQYVDGSQINVQVPWELQGQTSVLVKVAINFSYSNVYTLNLATYAPAFFEYPLNGTLFVAARDENFQLISTSNPAKRGHTISLYANGLGPVTNTPATGDATPDQPFSETTAVPTVTIGGKQANVGFHGLTPEVAGLYQINVTVPPDTPTGTQQLVLSVGGVTAKVSNIAVQ